MEENQGYKLWGHLEDEGSFPTNHNLCMGALLVKNLHFLCHMGFSAAATAFPQVTLKASWEGSVAQLKQQVFYAFHTT